MDSGVVTIPTRRLSMEMRVWVVVGTIFHRSQLVFHLDILLLGKRPFDVSNAVVQARQRLG